MILPICFDTSKYFFGILEKDSFWSILSKNFCDDRGVIRAFVGKVTGPDVQKCRNCAKAKKGDLRKKLD